MRTLVNGITCLNQYDQLISFAVHDVKLKQPNEPVVNVGTKGDPRWVPSELCTVLAGQVARRMLLPNQTRNMIEFAARPPNQNAESIVGPGLSVMQLAPNNQGVNARLVRPQRYPG